MSVDLIELGLGLEFGLGLGLEICVIGAVVSVDLVESYRECLIDEIW